MTTYNNTNNNEIAEAMAWLQKNGMAKKSSMAELAKTQRQVATGTTHYETAARHAKNVIVRPKG